MSENESWSRILNRTWRSIILYILCSSEDTDSAHNPSISHSPQTKSHRSVEVYSTFGSVLSDACQIPARLELLRYKPSPSGQISRPPSLFPHLFFSEGRKLQEALHKGEAFPHLFTHQNTQTHSCCTDLIVFMYHKKIYKVTQRNHFSYSLADIFFLSKRKRFKC